jgi:hypothetical protein
MVGGPTALVAEARKIIELYMHALVSARLAAERKKPGIGLGR